MGINISIRFRKLRYELALTDKITVIVGDSGTGKSTIFKTVLNSFSSGNLKLSDKSFELVTVNKKSDLLELRRYNNKVVIIDEDSIKFDKDIASYIRDSVHKYYIILSRTPVSFINYSLSSVKMLVYNNGINTLKDYISVESNNNNKVVTNGINANNSFYCVVEDTGYSREWFVELFKYSSITVDIEFIGGKNNVCNYAKPLLEKGLKVLFIVDSCSFGSCATEFKDLLTKFKGSIFMMSSYKSFEYMILMSNMFRDKLKKYSVLSSNFEEAYYEEQLSILSNTGKARIKHGSTKSIPKCYTEKCCPYNNRGVCDVGLKGSDKYVSMFIGTEFENLCRIAERMD